MATQEDVGRGESDAHPGLVARAVLRFEGFLQWWHGIFEYSTDPQCVWRIQVDRADQNVLLRDGTAVAVGDRILNLHLLNEHAPRMPSSGPTIAWGRAFVHRLDHSHRLLSEYLSRHPEYSEVVAIRCNVMVASERNTHQLLRIMSHCGFDFVPPDAPLNWAGRFHRFIDNAVGLLLCIAVNPGSVRPEVMQRVQSEVMISRRLLDQRYGASTQRSQSKANHPANAASG